MGNKIYEDYGKETEKKKGMELSKQICKEKSTEFWRMRKSQNPVEAIWRMSCPTNTMFTRGNASLKKKERLTKPKRKITTWIVNTKGKDKVKKWNN